jgi:hypothetical protein
VSKLTGASLTTVVADCDLRRSCRQVQDRRPNASSVRTSERKTVDKPRAGTQRPKVDSLCFGQAQETADAVSMRLKRRIAQEVHPTPESNSTPTIYGARGQRRKSRFVRTPERRDRLCSPTDSRNHLPRRKSRVRGYSTDRSSGGIFATNPGVWPWSWNRARRLASASYELTG